MGEGPYSDADARAQWPDVRLSPTEVQVLRYLMNHPGQPISATELLREVWGYANTTRSRTVSTTMARLRKKLEPDPNHPTVLLNLRGQGYTLALPRPHVDASPRERPTNARPPDNSLVGRAHDLAELLRLLRDGRRMVTLHGTGGIGKTRLALHAAATLHTERDGGAWFVNLASARTSSDVLHTIATVCDVDLGRARDDEARDQLGRLLARRGAMLLVLDNFEQLAPPAVDVVWGLLEQATALQVLATSRVRLQLADEVVFTLDRLQPEDATELLRQRICDARRDRSAPLDDSLMHTIAGMVDGIPLALELAAARSRWMSLAELAAHLRCSLASLSDEQGVLPARQRTLRRTISWSWELLDPVEQAALVQLAAFRGGCPRDAALQVVHAVGRARAVLNDLVDSSMVNTEWSHEGVRLSLYDSVRDFALDQDHPELAAARDRHATWAFDLAADCHSTYNTDPNAGRTLWRERDNMASAKEEWRRSTVCATSNSTRS